MKTVFYIVNGLISVLLYFVNTLVWFMPLMVCSLIKLIPIVPLQKAMSFLTDACATMWISINSINQSVFSRTQFVAEIPASLSTKQWYLVIANHQSWVDILVLQRIFNRKIPFLKFFLKQNLIFVPFLGLCWWGLDFPFMKRYSKETLKKKPHLKGKDLETTKKSCEKFENKPVSIMNFVEGTRFNEAKTIHPLNQKLGLRQTLAPKTGGVAFVLNAMSSRLTDLVNVTIYYPNGIPSYWDFVCGKVKKVVVHIDTIKIETLLQENIYSPAYFTSNEQKAKFQDYLNALWQQKEQRLVELDSEHGKK